jgi:hypothetical protein
MAGSNELIIYTPQDGKLPLGLVFDGETIWGTQDHIAQIFDTSKQVVSYHIGNIFETGEVDRKSGVKESLTPVENQGTRQIQYYNLDVVISVGYRINSKKATDFRKWSTSVLRDQILGRTTNDRLTHDEERVKVADRIAVENNELLETGYTMGVEDAAVFLDVGYKGLYGMPMQEIKKKKGLKNERLLDRAGTTELVANEFRITQTNAILKDYIEEDGILVGHGVALTIHWQVGQEIREAIGRMGGKLPEDIALEPDHISEARKRVLTSKVKPKISESTSDSSSVPPS